ncbi:MAG: ABC transporter ATP-binding protein [Acetobacteraceae bacterium]|nr:ABC transporter ATP-binding protein [Acetobacteraceae bacterium]
MSAPVVLFRGVTKSYDGRSLAVAPLDLAVAEGEFLTLLGPSGSGKTTTLMMLAGFEAPSSGEILLEGRVVNRVPPHRRGLGVVFQNYALFPHMSVAENLSFPLEMRRIPRAERAERIARALATVRMEGFADRRPAQLSGGQQQRVALARALIFSPRLVLMDEPLGALDRQLREELQQEIKALHARLGVTILYVTHDQGEALALSDRIAVFRAGRIEQLGTPRELYDRPASAFVAGFLGENNLIPVEVLGAEGAFRRCRLPDGGTILVPGCRPPGPALLVLRPERILPGAEGPNRLSATVLGATFLGDQTRLSVALGPATLAVKLPHGAAGHGLARGERIALCFPPEAAALLPPEGGG